MSKYLRTLQPTDIYAAHDTGAPILDTAPAGTMLPYNREKRRNGINWMEIYRPDGSKAYIKKDSKGIFKCEYAELDDEEVLGFSYTVKQGPHLPFKDAFKPMVGQEVLAKAELRRTMDYSKGEMEQVLLAYDPEWVEVKPFQMYKKEVFYVTNKEYFGNSLVEIDDLEGKKGFVLPKTNYTETKDKWMLYLIYIIAGISVLATFAVCLALGWIVIGLILLIPGIIVAFILVFLLKIVFSILEGIFNQIRKRF